MKKYALDHVCLPVKDLDAAVTLFTEVFGMELFRTRGTAPNRKVWLDGGIQLVETETFSPTGGMDHLALDVPDDELEAVFALAAQYGCTQAEGMTPYQWLRLPEGQLLEFADLTKRYNSK